MRIRHLLAVLLVLGLGTMGAMAATYTVYPTAETNTTGSTDYVAKTDGEVLAYGGLVTGTVRQATGYLKFDVTSVPDATPVTTVIFHFYVNATNWPYFSITPLTLNPVPITATASALWDDAQGEKNVGFYNQQDETSAYAPGWKSVVLGGTATADVISALTADWFAIGFASRDDGAGGEAFFTEVDGATDTNVPYLVVADVPPPANDTCAGAIAIPSTPGVYTYTGDTTYATNAYDCNSACVSNLGHSGQDVTYTVTVPADCSVCVTLNQSEMTWNGAVYMVTDCADVNGTCVAGASGWLAGGLDEAFCYTDTNSTETYYIIVDGRDGGGAGAFSLDVQVSCIDAPYGLTCTDDGNGAGTLAWTNGDTYDNVEVYQDGNLVSTLGGAATSITVTGISPGYHCYYVCGVLATDVQCSNECCLIQGYDNIEVVYDFEADDGGGVVDGTGAWEWGAPTYGPCVGGGTTNVWATDLDADYASDACWLLNSGPVSIADTGGFVSFDHCYDIEAGYDGGVVWFTTDDFWYYNFEPLEGTDSVINGFTPTACQWVEGRNGFTGDSGGWVTDVWDFTDPLWAGQDVSIRFAFGSDSSVVYSGWLVDNITLYSLNDSPIDCAYTITPLLGTVPFTITHRVTLENLLSGSLHYTRRIAGSIGVITGNGASFNPWHNGFSNVNPGTSFTTAWNVNLPAHVSVIGNNTFTMTVEDVTPSPYNQPPYPPSGTTCTQVNVVVANAP